MTNSPPNKLFDGQTGFPTPNAPPELTGCRVFIIPSDEEWFALFMAAALRLTYEWAWFKNGDLTQAEAAAAWSAIIDDAYARSLLGTCLVNVPAPYWDEDSADDADDEMSVETQIWYGEIVASPAFVAEDAELTFLDNLGIWAIAGFIAYAGQPGAALAFVPLAKTFVLAFKQHSLGGVVRVLVDFLHLADIDTYGVEDAVLNLNVVMPDDGDPHTLYVEMADESNPLAGDTPNIQVIRKRLSESEVTPPNTRWNSDCDCVQTSPDDGTTWNEDDGADPRKNPAGLLPALSGDTAQCDAAARMAAALHRYVDTVLAAASIIEAINGVLSFLLVFLPAIGIILAAIGAGVEALFGIGTTAINLAMTDAVYLQIQCIIMCHISADGQMTQAQLDAINADIAANVATIPNAVWSIYQNALGFVGLSNSAVKGTETGDCTSCACAWTYRWDFTLSEGDFENCAAAGGTPVWTDGLGWLTQYYGNGNAYGFYSEGYIWSQAFDVPSDCRITKFVTGQSDINHSGGDHYEAWIGADRTEGLTRPFHAYQVSWLMTQETDGEIDGAITGQRFCFGTSPVGAQIYLTFSELSGSGTPPNFTGGAFI